MDKLKFGEFIYTKRKSLGLTQDDLGRRLGVTNKAVSKWETGETLPDIQILPMLASALNVTIDELITLEKPSPEVIIKPQCKKALVLLIILSSILALISLVLSIILINSDKKPKLNINNYNDYLMINFSEYGLLSEQNLLIKGDVKELCEVDDLKLTLSFTVKYYYLNNNDDICEILYLNKEVSINEDNHSFEIMLFPKNTIADFKSAYSFQITYLIVDVKGNIL